MAEQSDRRNAIKKSLAAGAALAAPQIIPSTVFGANDTIIMGIIGPGGRGCSVMGMCQTRGVKFAAVCDVSKPRMEAGVARAKENNDGKISEYADYRKLLEQKDLDAVLIATPEHQHCSQLIDAVKAGLDAYCEKPMSHTIEEGAKTVKEVRKTKQIVQIGMQRRSAPMVHKGLEVIRSGILGNVSMVRAHWNWQASGPLNNEPLNYELDWERFMWPSKNVKFEPKKVRNWRLFWPFSGGLCCDQGTHIMDVVQWYMNGGTPLEADCFGDIVSMTGAETPDVFSATYRYRDYLATWSLSYNTTYEDWWHIIFYGKKATMHLHRFGYTVYEEPIGHEPKNPVIELKGDLPSQPHVDNFVECIQSREEPNAPVEVGHTAVCGPHLANVALRKNRRARLNPKATKVST